MTAPNLAVVNLATSAVSAINPTPEQPTADQLAADLKTLETELASCKLLASEVSTRSYRLQAVTTAHALGNVGIAELRAAQADLDAAVEATPRRSFLEAGIADMRGRIDHARGVERKAFCDSIADDYKRAYETFVEQGKAMLETYNRMRSLNNTYLGMTSRPLMDDYLTAVHLPQLHGPNDGMGSLIPTGRR